MYASIEEVSQQTWKASELKIAENSKVNRQLGLICIHSRRPTKRRLFTCDEDRIPER